MYPGVHAASDPDKLAATLADTGETLTYGQLEERSVRLSRALHDAGLRKGDVVALLSENSLRAFEVYWAAIRSGLYVTAVNHHLAPDEVGYIVADSYASALVVSSEKAEIATALLPELGHLKSLLAFGGDVEGFAPYEDALAAASPEPLDEQPHGAPMLYSSGTTGLPKGVKPPLPPVSLGELGDPVTGLAKQHFGVGPDTVYLSPAPVYHAAPLRWCGAVQALGGHVVMMRKFHAERSLAAISEFGVTHGQFVPTMFVRMLQLPDEVRAAHDTSSLRLALHAAAPCPVEVKQKMIDWWGPILVEYYAGTEGNGMTVIDSAAWAEKQGSVGRAVLGTPRVCDDDGDELPAGEIGNVYFERDHVPFEYHNDPEKTKKSQHPAHPNWTTLGDIGYLDGDGFLFLTDRKSFTIISGGVNIYPQEIENVLVLHPAIRDVAVVGLPDPEMGESVTAFVEPRDGIDTNPELGEEIIEFVKARIASFKAPRSVRFVDTLPRTETGKLVKGDLKRKYANA
ncbi:MULTISPECIES: acyl-CoA synthetase [unclassified Pseudonocardia]|uniref:acyl-CoA synthetase n=1 Tax=unclassified Pseudonocardia TaxID=2619320 RepID=UPI0004925AD6|nr:acyl-CoA synthetase [Pseudonocardia sp. Ae707_Ps1]OLM16774.1 O-succinylbenzoic acid--CoA ligase [Pseudonocardia sp. Ae707_Ps1]